MKITVDDVMSWGPCPASTRARVEELWTGRKYILHTTLAKLNIPPCDRLWALIRCLIKSGGPLPVGSLIWITAGRHRNDTECEKYIQIVLDRIGGEL